MSLDFASKLGNQALRRFRQELREGKRADALNHGGRDDRRDQRNEHLHVSFADDVVDQIFGGVREREAAHPIDGHQNEADRQDSTTWLDQSPNVG